MKMKKSTLEKMQQTCLDRYGVVNSMQAKDIHTKAKQTCLDRYGVENVMQNNFIRTKMQQTCLDRYGVEHALQSSLCQDHRKQTCLDRYGVESFTQTDEYKKKTKQTCLNRYGVEYVSQNKQFQIDKKIKYFNQFQIEHPNQNKLINFNGAIYDSTFWENFNSIAEIKCKLTPYMSESVIYDWIHRYRPDLIGTGYTISSHHQQIINLLNKQHIDYTINDRTIISPQELDIYIPSKNLAIEINGVYWHSELAGSKDQHYHLNKTLQCQALNIQLLHFWDIEIENQWDLISSMILNRCEYSQKINGRQCKIIDVPYNDERDFLKQNHIQGYTVSSYCKGLIYQNELVSLMSFRKSRYNRKFDWEMLRFCTKQNIHVIGGASKLLKQAPNGSLISYADRRYSQGQLYPKLGFSLIHFSDPGYYYTQDYQKLFHRSSFQKHLLEKKLESFDPSLTEWENMMLNGFDRVWDCRDSCLRI